jgi:Tol biopolymer transport system component
MQIATLFNKTTLSTGGFVAALLLSTNVHAAGKNGLIAFPCRSNDGHQNICLIDPTEPETSPSSPITSGGDNALPAWSPDGTMLAYAHFEPDSGMVSIMVMEVTDQQHHGPARFISLGVWPAWSPDGRDIAFTALSSTMTAEIWAIHPDGTNKRQLTDAPGFQKVGATWGHGGQFIAYTQQEPALRPSGFHKSVWVTKLVGNKESHELTTGFICPGPPPQPCFQNLDADGNVIDSEPVLDAGAPAWSPTGDDIIFWSGLETFAGQLWTIDSNGKHREQLTFPDKPRFSDVTPPYPNNDDPRWAPDGKKIVFSTNRTIVEVPFSPPCSPDHIPCHIGFPQMWVMNADGSEQHFIANNTSGPLPGNAAWQPAGRRDAD